MYNLSLPNSCYCLTRTRLSLRLELRTLHCTVGELKYVSVTSIVGWHILEPDCSMWLWPLVGLSTAMQTSAWTATSLGPSKDSGQPQSVRYTCQFTIWLIGGFRGGVGGSLRPEMFSISCSFLEKLANSYVGAPHLDGWRPLLLEILDPPLWLKIFWKKLHALLAFIAKYGVPTNQWTWLCQALLEVSMTTIALWMCLCRWLGSRKCDKS